MKHIKRNRAGKIRQVRISNIAAEALDKHLKGAFNEHGLRLFPRQFVSEAILKAIP